MYMYMYINRYGERCKERKSQILIRSEGNQLVVGFKSEAEESKIQWRGASNKVDTSHRIDRWCIDITGGDKNKIDCGRGQETNGCHEPASPSSIRVSFIEWTTSTLFTQKAYGNWLT